jgi:cytosine deaminase
MYYNPFDELLISIANAGGFVNCHAHFDRAYTVSRQNMEDVVYSQLQEKWELVDEYKAYATQKDYEENITTALLGQEVMGIRKCFSFIDLDPVVGWKAIRAAKTVQAKMNNLQFKYAFQTLKGVLETDCMKMMEKAVDNNMVDALGSLPAADKDPRLHLNFLMHLARSSGMPLHVHVDQNNVATEKETEMLARATMKWGMEGRVVAIHGISIAAHPKKYRQEVYQMCKDAGIMFVACPTAWIDSRRTEVVSPTHNAVTPVDEMIGHDIVVGLGTDNIHDIYKPYSTGDMAIELKFLLEATHIYDHDVLFDIAVTNGQKILNL